MSDDFDPAAVAAADQDLARLNRLLDAMVHAWLKSAAEYSDPTTQIAALSYTLCFIAQPEQAREFAQQHGLESVLPADATFLHPVDLPCLLAIAINRLSKRPEDDDIPARKFVDDFGRQWEWCGGQPGTWAWRYTDGQQINE